MAWTFLQEDVKNLLNEKVVVVIGDSNMRGMYKDIVCLLTEGRLLRPKELKAKGELEFLNDKLLKGGKLGKLNNGINYTEVRRVDTGHTVVRFYFVTRCFSNYVQTILAELKKFLPDVIIMNSCVWDLHRYGPHGIAAFKQNLQKLVVAVKNSMGPNTLFIWTGSLPMAKKCKGGFILPFMDTIPSREVVEGNYFAQDLMSRHDHIFLDLHAIFSVQLHHRCADGIHWNNIAHRRISNLLLSQISKSWELPLQRHFASWHPPLVGSLYPGGTNLACMSHAGSFGFPDPGGIGRSPFDLASGSSSSSSSKEISEEEAYKNRFGKFALVGSTLPAVGDKTGSVVAAHGGTGRSFFDLASSSSGSEEMSKEEAYKNRFGKFALVTSTLPVGGSNNNQKDKAAVGYVVTAHTDASKDLVLPTSVTTSKVKTEPVGTMSKNQSKDSAQVTEHGKTDADGENSQCSPSTGKAKKGNGKKRKKQDENDLLEKQVETAEVNEKLQTKKLKYDIHTSYNIQPVTKVSSLSPLNQALSPRNHQAYHINQLLKPTNQPALPTGQVYPKVPPFPNHLLNPSNIALANNRFHPYAWYQRPQWWPGAAPSTFLLQKPRNLVYRPTAPGYGHGVRPSWRSPASPAEHQFPYQEMLKLMKGRVPSRYH